MGGPRPAAGTATAGGGDAELERQHRTMKRKYKQLQDERDLVRAELDHAKAKLARLLTERR